MSLPQPFLGRQYGLEVYSTVTQFEGFKQKIIGSEGIFCWQNPGNLYIHVHRALSLTGAIAGMNYPLGEPTLAGGS
jgi:hypothetical protein